MKVKPLIIYHDDCNDGLVAAWSAKQALPEAELFPGRYGQPPPDATGRQVIIVDFSYKRQPFEALLAQADSVLLLDHHKTALEELGAIEHPRLTRVLDMNRSGAGIAWDHFHAAHPRPVVVDLVEDGDLWRFRYPETKAYMEALRSLPRTLDTVDSVAPLARGSLMFKMFVNLGEGLLTYKEQMVELACQHAKLVQLGPYTVWAANVPYFLSSETANRLIRDRAFGITYFLDKNGMWNLSLRSVGDFDVSFIARQYGGGGHKNASGIQLSSLPWE